MGKISTTALLKGILGTASTALTLGLLSSSQGMAATMTDVELSLLVDVSGSVNNSEFNLQRNGYADAFRSSSVIDGITNGNEGQIAANLIYWSDSNRQAEAVEWSSIDDAASANDFADAIATAPRPFGGATAPGSAIDFSVPGFNANEVNSTREVIDVSGDGLENQGVDAPTAGDNALEAGIDTLNGLVISDDPDVLSYYQDDVMGGSDAFVSQVDNFNQFGDAIENKLAAEITAQPVPEPLTVMGTLTAGGLGVFLKRRRKR